MRRFLFWFLVVALVGSIAGGAIVLLQPQTSLHHPDFGNDCLDLLTADTENAVDCVRVFYGTNRDVRFDGAGPGPEDEVDTSDVIAADSQQLHVGRADVWLPKLIEEGGTRERGETPFLKGEAPEEQDELVKYVFLTRITKAGRERFLMALDEALIDSNS